MAPNPDTTGSGTLVTGLTFQRVSRLALSSRRELPDFGVFVLANWPPALVKSSRICGSLCQPTGLELPSRAPGFLSPCVSRLVLSSRQELPDLGVIVLANWPRAHVKSSRTLGVIVLANQARTPVKSSRILGSLWELLLYHHSLRYHSKFDDLAFDPWSKVCQKY